MARVRYELTNGQRFATMDDLLTLWIGVTVHYEDDDYAPTPRDEFSWRRNIWSLPPL